MAFRLFALAALLALPLLASGCAPAGSVMLPPGVCSPSGSAVLFAVPNASGPVDTSRYSTENCRAK
jgi:hypothetical protein